MAMEVLERHHSGGDLMLIGIRHNGWLIAEKLYGLLKPDYAGNLQLAALQINKRQPAEVNLEPVLSCKEKKIILIDDVANSGRTLLYALRPLLQEYPHQIETLVLVARTHRSFPVALDYVGLSVSTSPHEFIAVSVSGKELSGAAIESTAY
jgi:pyrimidine operon attenuation protein/uracil phosphoribosyltransferase